MENRDKLAIPFEAPEPPAARRTNRRVAGGPRHGPALSMSASMSAPEHQQRARDQQGPERSLLPDLIASRLNDVSSGVFSTVSEFRVSFSLCSPLSEVT